MSGMEEWEDNGAAAPEWAEGGEQTQEAEDVDLDWGGEEEVEAKAPPSPLSILHPVDAEHFSELLTSLESVAGDWGTDEQPAIVSILRRLVDVVFRARDPSGAADGVLVNRILQAIDSDTAKISPVARDQIALELFSIYLQHPTLRLGQSVGRAGPAIQRFVKRDIRINMSPVGRAGILGFMPLRFYSAMRLATLVQDLWRRIDGVYAIGDPRRADLETLVLEVAYHASLPTFGREGEQRLIDWLATGYRSESGSLSEAAFENAHPGPYGFLRRCRARLRKCRNTTTFHHHLPVCDIPTPLIWGPVSNQDEQCYDVRELLPNFAAQLAVGTGQQPSALLYPPTAGDRGRQTPVGVSAVRTMARRASQHGLAVPADVEQYLDVAQQQQGGGSGGPVPPRRRASGKLVTGFPY